MRDKARDGGAGKSKEEMERTMEGEESAVF